MNTFLKSFTCLLPGMTVVLAACIGSAAFAQAPATPAPAARAANSLKALDTNRDGQLSREEVKGHPRLEKAFDAIDTNKDGQLSREELKAFREAHKGQAKK